jgi:hypothetical protein
MVNKLAQLGFNAVGCRPKNNERLTANGSFGFSDG